MNYDRVYVRSDADGSLHIRARARIGSELLRPDRCKTKLGPNVTFVQDLRAVALEDLCPGCFDANDPRRVVEASYAAEQDPEDAA